MVHQINRLTARSVEAISKPGRHCDGGGLYLSVGSDGRRRWIFLFRWQRKLTELGLGSARKGARGYVGLKEARERADGARTLLKDGSNPLAVKHKKAERVPDFGEFATEFVENLTGSFSNVKHRKQWSSTLKTYCTSIWLLPVDEITTSHVEAVLKPIWATKAETASRLRGRIERVLAAAKVKNFRTGENPAAWDDNLRELLGERETLTRGHFPAMPWKQIPAFMAQLRTRDAVSARALEFMILGACRGGEVRGARFSEVDFSERVWVVPAERMKGKKGKRKAHRVPLTARMLEILTEARGATGGDLVFPSPGGTKPLSASAHKVLLERMGHGEVTPHGFRSSFRDWTADCTTFANEVCEAALAHAIKNKAEAAYRRGEMLEKRRKLMDAWAGFCAPPKVAGKVVSINRGAAVSP